MSEKAKGQDGLSWPWTMDAQVWAAEFKRLFPESDEGLMLSWFANAIMCGYDTARQRDAQQLADVAYLEAWVHDDASDRLLEPRWAGAGVGVVSGWRVIDYDRRDGAELCADSLPALGALLRQREEGR